MEAHEGQAQEGKAYPEIVEEIAAQIAEHRVVPFLGAGCSARQLGVDWDALARIFVPPDGGGLGPIDAASKFVEREGREALLKLLEERLSVAAYDPVVSPVSDLVASMEFGLLYTTNQDRLIELCFEACGRALNVVVRYSDFAIQDPSATTLYKYHGDFSDPTSIVFTSEDYEQRMTHGATLHNPFEVRLRSDCLSKHLLFLGYSLRDLNVQRLLKQLRATFGRELPKSYLVQFSPDETFAQEVREHYGVIAVDTSTLYPKEKSNAECFERFLKDLNECTVNHRLECEMEALFEGGGPAAHRVVTVRDQEAVEAALQSDRPDGQVGIFRSIYDAARIPEALQSSAASQFIRLCRNTRGPAAFGEVKAAFHNLHLGSADHALELTSAAMAVANELQTGDSIGTFLSAPASVHSPIDREYSLVTVVMALRYLADWNRTVSKAMYRAIAYWDPRLPPGFDPTWGPAFREVLDQVYRRGATTYENPLDRAERLKDHPKTFRVPSIRELNQDMLKLFAQRMKRPPMT
jgi:hypothetical protein